MTYVVDDGSSDSTQEVLRRFKAAPLLRVISHALNQGKAAAMRSGFEAALADGYTHAATVDTDGQLDPEDAQSLIQAASTTPASLVLGVRELNIDRYPVSNRLGRRLANTFIRLECGLRVSDSQCGLRVYPLSLLWCVPVRAGRYGFETEVITRAVWAGTSVVEIPVACRYFPVGERVSHFRPLVDTIRAIGLHAFLLGRRLLPLPHPKWPTPAAPDLKAHGIASTAASLPFSGEVEPGAVRVAK